MFARHPAIGQVAVIGIPDDVHGEEICAVVVLDPSASSKPGAEELLDWGKERLGRHKYPRRVEFAESLPMGPSGKILKREIVKTL